MAYSNKRVALEPTAFPPPQHWMVWIADYDYPNAHKNDGKKNPQLRSKDVGTIRHYDTLAKAKKGLRWNASAGSYATHYKEPGTFLVDWAILHYNLDKQEWEIAHQGYAGEHRDNHPLWQRRFTKAEREDPMLVAAEATASVAEQRAIASIMESLRNVDRQVSSGV